MVGYFIIVMMYVDFISSPYLLVFSDDRVRGTREQRMLMQVELVTLSYEEGISGVFYITCIFYIWKWNVNSFETFILNYDILVILNFDFISSLYLLVFGDDRVRGTREQRMLMQMELVTLSYGEGISGVFYITFIFYFWKWNVNSFETFILNYDIW